MSPLAAKLRLYWPLIKSPQTGLLVFTGLAGYMSARCPVYNLPTMAVLLVSLAASISGSTILNMWWDRDIDAKMRRTQNRPLPSGKIRAAEALIVGLAISFLGVALAFALDVLYGAIILAGLFFDVVIYTIWLKRRTCWGIVWGGISGGMPVLAGRALGLGGVDWIGVMLAAAVLFWIPTHILTFSTRYLHDYQEAGVPTFPSVYGICFTRNAIATASVLAAIAMGFVAWGIGISWGFFRLLGVLSVGLLLWAVVETLKPSERGSFGLFKYASIYMLASMVVIVFGVL
jgi:protoheme IX farnesyltransferase